MSTKTKGEAFAGLSVAITTPFRDSAVDYPALRAQIEFQIEAGTNCFCPVGTTGECPTLEPRRARAGDRRDWSNIAAGRIKVMPGTGSNSTAEALRLTTFADKARRRCGPGRRSLLQQADAGRLLSALQGPGRSGRHSDLRLQHPRPHRQEHRAGNDCPHGRAAEHHDGQGSDRLDGPGLADHRPVESHGAQRRRQPDACRLMAIGGAGRDFRRGQHRAARRDRADQGLRCRQSGRSARAGIASSFRSAATCWAWPPTRSPSRPPCSCWAATPAVLRMPMTPLDATSEARLRGTLSKYGLL